MSPLNLAIVGLRLLAIYLFLQAGPLLATVALFSAFLDQVKGHTAIASLYSTSILSASIPAGSQVLLSILLFLFSAPLARRLVPPATDESKTVACSLEEVQTIAFAVTGILILASALPNLGRAWQSFYYWWFNTQQQSGQISLNSRYSDSLMYPAGIFIQLILGLLLLINPRGFRNIWHWLRTAGT